MASPRALAFVAVVGLLVLVVAAASGATGHPPAVTGQDGLGIGGDVADVAVALVAAAWTLIAYRVASVARVSGTSVTGPGSARRQLWGPVAAIALLAVIWAAWALLGHHQPSLAQPQHGSVTGHANALEADGRAGLGSAPVLAGVGAAVVGILASALVSRVLRGRLKMPLPLPGPLDEDLSALQGEAVAAVDWSLAALEATAVPRQAVIAAYASMDRSLGQAGMGRQPWEAPLEHLDRVMAGLGAAGPDSVALAGLYEEAKFGHHSCGPQMKRQALDALAGMRRALLHPGTQGTQGGSGTQGTPAGSSPAPAGPGGT